jgi:hypothetical protein
MQTVIRKETQGVTDYAEPGRLKIPDETFRNRNGEADSHTDAMSLRMKAALSGTARSGVRGRTPIRPFELYFFGAFAALGGPIPDGHCASAPDLFASSVRPVLLAHCAPCHEPGGKMYARLPFDDATAVAGHSAGILRRLKGADAAVIEKWVATQHPSPQPSPAGRGSSHPRSSQE